MTKIAPLKQVTKKNFFPYFCLIPFEKINAIYSIHSMETDALNLYNPTTLPE